MEDRRILKENGYEYAKRVRERMDSVRIRGFVTVWQEDGKGKRTYLVKGAKNHFVDAGLRGLLSALVGNYLFANESAIIRALSYTPKIYLGKDTGTPTTHGMTSLMDPIGTAPGTPPNSVSGSNITNPETGKWVCSYRAIWNPGVITEQVGEMALYLRPFTNITPNWSYTTSGTYTYSEKMVSRTSVADGDFDAFTPDPSKSLTVQWEVMVTYA